MCLQTICHDFRKVVMSRSHASYKDMMRGACSGLLALTNQSRLLWEGAWKRRTLTHAVSQFRISIHRRSIWKPITLQRRVKPVPIWRLLLLNVASFSLFLEDAPLRILCGLAYPKILCVPGKEERKRENGDIMWRRSSLSRALWRKGKTSGDTTRKCSKG